MSDVSASDTSCVRSKRNRGDSRELQAPLGEIAPSLAPVGALDLIKNKMRQKSERAQPQPWSLLRAAGVLNARPPTPLDTDF